jgi:hypothetical protein
MPWKIVKEHSQCKSGYAVVKTDGKFVACHKTRQSALAQIRALYASERK